MAAAILVIEGDVTYLEGNAASMRLVASFLEMTSRAAQLADANQGAILDFVPFALVPQALVTQLLVRIIPWAVNRGLDTANLPHVHGGRSGGEGIGDVVAEASIPVGAGDAACGLGELESLVRELFA